jgi:uncharacterized protein YktB (UPF0637 family)
MYLPKRVPERHHPVKAWASWWKRRATNVLGYKEEALWQQGLWDTRLYSWDAYRAKLDYVSKNPARARLIDEDGAWPYQGMIHPLARY